MSSMLPPRLPISPRSNIVSPSLSSSDIIDSSMRYALLLLLLLSTVVGASTDADSRDAVETSTPLLATGTDAALTLLIPREPGGLIIWASTDGGSPTRDMGVEVESGDEVVCITGGCTGVIACGVGVVFVGVDIVDVVGRVAPAVVATAAAVLGVTGISVEDDSTFIS